jgi:glutamine synthetase
MTDITKKLEEFKDVGFVKYQFTDMQGNIREVTLTKENVKDSGHTSVDGSSVFGKIIPPTESDMLLIPDPETFHKIPWTEDTARVICNVYYPPAKEGEEPKPFEGCPRGILSDVEKEMEKTLEEQLKDRFPGEKAKKFHAHFAPEVEFILVDEDYLSAAIHLDQGLRNDHYFVPPRKKVDEVLKQITKYLAEMEMKKEKYHTEVTTFQHEIGIGYSNVLRMADATMTLKYIIENVAQTHGLRASFIPKFRKGVNGNGMHVHQNLAVTVDKEEYNLFFDEKEKTLSDIGRQYIAGLLRYAREITALTNPIPVSYKRLVPGCEAPTYIAWDWENRTALCRGHSRGTSKVRVEYRAPDPKCNPYLAFAAMLSAGLEGISRGSKLPAPDKRDFYQDNEGVKELPANLGEALEEMKKSEMLKRRLGAFIVDNLYDIGINTWKTYSQEVSDIDIRAFF